MNKLGLQVDASDFFSSAYAAAKYFQTIPKFCIPTAMRKKKVYVIGDKGILQEFSLANIDYIYHEEGANMASGKIIVDPDIGAVCVGLDVK